MKTGQKKDNVINWGDLMKRLGDEGIIIKIVSSFIADNIKRLESLAEAIQADEPDDVKYYAHLLRGAAATVGAVFLSKAVYKLEVMGEQRCLQGAWPVFEETRAEFDRLKLFLAEPDWIQIVKEQSGSSDKLEAGA